MKRIILQASFALAAILISSLVNAQIEQQFNTTPAAPSPTDIKPHLQGRCWQFPNMDVNAGSWDNLIEGDGAMVSNVAGNDNQTAGIYTPVLDVPGSLAVGFTYKFERDIDNIAVLNFYLTDCNNNIVMQLAHFPLSGHKGDLIYTYNNTFANLPSGAYKLYIEYEVMGGNNISIDQLQINVPFKYASGCNEPPVAGNDYFVGKNNRTATGQVITNDHDPNGDYFTTYLITGSPDGTVTLNSDGTFTFVPNAGFTGSSTSFTYQVCDNGFAPACSNEANVTINFAAGMLPVRLADFTASVNDANDVTVSWATTYEQGSSHFIVERSYDGVNFEDAGKVKAAGNSFNKKEYAFTEKVRNGVSNKKDLFYRLRMVDNNGREELTRVLVLRLFKTTSLKMVSVTPNPVVNDINVQVQLKTNAYIVMKVTSNSGVEVARKSIRGNEGQNVFTLDGTSKLKPGIYMLEVIINSNERISVKLVKN
ncbi:MAG TPA: Ig-like domain-containing protein [Chitinophagaceae bacterium]|nr:Ig-like domain-containing protein [Chitinophagaceae bacterium]